MDSVVTSHVAASNRSRPIEVIAFDCMCVLIRSKDDAFPLIQSIIQSVRVASAQEIQTADVSLQCDFESYESLLRDCVIALYQNRSNANAVAQYLYLAAFQNRELILNAKDMPDIKVGLEIPGE